MLKEKGEKLKKIESYQEMSKLIFSCFKKNVMTNCFLSKEDWEFEINNKSVYYFMVENSLFLIREREKFFILNYYLNDWNIEKIKIEMQQEISKPVVVEVVSKNILDESYLKQQELFFQLGMQKTLERVRFQNVEQVENLASEKENLLVTSENINNEIDTKFESDFESESEITFANIDDLAGILELLHSSFNLYYGCIPTQEKLSEDIQKNFVYIAKKENRILGVLHFEKSDKQTEIRHLAVDKDFRGKGIANHLMRIYGSEIKVPRRIVWTGVDNIPAQKLYQKYGYQKDGYVSSVFYCENLLRDRKG